MDRPFVQAAENNKRAILEAITPYLGDARLVLELAAGTGQHAVHFAAALPGLVWQATDLPAAMPGLCAWQEAAALDNLPPPLALDIRRLPWPIAAADAVYASNILHFLPREALAELFAGAAAILVPGAWLLVYGPLHVSGAPVSPGNRQLDEWLARQDPRFAIRQLDEVVDSARHNGFRLCQDHTMPANNHLLAWQRA